MHQRVNDVWFVLGEAPINIFSQSGSSIPYVKVSYWEKCDENGRIVVSFCYQSSFCLLYRRSSKLANPNFPRNMKIGLNTVVESIRDLVH